MDKSFIIGAISIAITLFAIWASTDNVWNSPSFDIKAEDLDKNEKDQRPVDEIVRTIYNDKNYLRLNATWLRTQDSDFLQFLRETNRFSSEDIWILDRIYFNPHTEGRSQKISITNNGLSQAHDVLVQISGENNFKIIEYTCPEIMSDDQIIKNLGKNYIVSISRMSVNLDCEITINSVGNSGIKKIIVTAEESRPRVWPDDLINDRLNVLIIVNIIGYIAVGVLAIVIAYNVAKLFEKRTNQKKAPV